MSAIFSIPVDDSGYWRVYEVSTEGRREWVDYIPVQDAGTEVAASARRTNADGYMEVNALSDVTGLDEWRDYTPIVTVTGRANAWSYGHVPEQGYIPVYAKTGSLGGGGGGDPFSADVTSQLIFEAADGTQTITDEVGGGPSWTFATNTDISTDQANSGSSSLHCTGSNPSYLEATTTTETAGGFGTGDFTVEFWIYPNSLTGFQIVYDQRVAGANEAKPALYFNASSLRYFVSNVDRIIGPGGSLVTGAWQHVALCRSSGTTRLFVDGTQIGADFADTTDYGSSSAIRIGRYILETTTMMNAYYEDFRITKAARYTTDFTPPAAF